MKKLFAISLVLVALSAFGQKQKIKFDNDTAIVDGTPYVILEKVRGTTITKIKSIEGKDLIILRYDSYTHAKYVDNTNKTGELTYMEFQFTNDKRVCETYAQPRKWIVKTLLENKLIENNEVNVAEEDAFTSLHGTRFSEEKKLLFGGNTIIINNN